MAEKGLRKTLTHRPPPRAPTPCTGAMVQVHMPLGLANLGYGAGAHWACASLVIGALGPVIRRGDTVGWNPWGESRCWTEQKLQPWFPTQQEPLLPVQVSGLNLQWRSPACRCHFSGGSGYRERDVVHVTEEVGGAADVAASPSPLKKKREANKEVPGILCSCSLGDRWTGGCPACLAGRGTRRRKVVSSTQAHHWGILISGLGGLLGHHLMPQSTQGLTFDTLFD